MLNIVNMDANNDPSLREVDGRMGSGRFGYGVDEKMNGEREIRIPRELVEGVSRFG